MNDDDRIVPAQDAEPPKHNTVVHLLAWYTFALAMIGLIQVVAQLCSADEQRVGPEPVRQGVTEGVAP